MTATPTKSATTKATTSKPRTRKTTPAPVTVDINSPAFQAAVQAGVQAALAAQNSTPAPVAAVEVDPVQALVAGRGLSFAKGGRAYLTLHAAQAVARVLKTGTPEIVAAAGEKSEERRSVTHLAVWRTEGGNVAFHPLYRAA